MNKPNLIVPLVAPYDERGMDGFTHTITNSEDNRKINCYFEKDANEKPTLVKRPGISLSQSYGVSADSAETAYLISRIPSNTLNLFWLYSTVGNDVRVSDLTSTSVIFSSAAAYIPSYIDRTLLSGLDTIVLQTVNATPAHRVFYTSNSIGAAWSEITDVDFTGLTPTGKLEHMDGYAFILDRATNKIFNSDLNSLANWNSTNFITKQIEQDRAVGLANFKDRILAFGDQTVEIFYNAGNATGSPLSPIKLLAANVGLSSSSLPTGGSHYYCVVENKMYFMGALPGSSGFPVLMMFDGSNFFKVSTTAVDKIMYTGTNGFVYSINNFTVNQQEAIAISLVSITTATQRWLMYFPSWNYWFEWTSTVFTPRCIRNVHVGAAANTNLVFQWKTTDNWQDNGSNFTSSIQFKLPQDGHQRKRMAEFGVLADTARSSNQLLVEFSDDDYQSFYTVGNIELQREIKTLNRGGSYRKRAVRLSSTNALETRLSAFIARIE